MDPQDHFFPIVQPAKQQHFENVLLAANAHAHIVFLARESALANWLTVVCYLSWIALHQSATFCRLAWTKQTNKKCHDHIWGKNFVRQNQIICIIYAPVIRHTDRLDSLVLEFGGGGGGFLKTFLEGFVDYIIYTVVKFERTMMIMMIMMIYWIGANLFSVVWQEVQLQKIPSWSSYKNLSQNKLSLVLGHF